MYRNVIEILVDRNIHDKSKSIVLKCGEKKKLIHDVERVWQELLYANVPPFYRDAPHNGFKSILKYHTNNFHTLKAELLQLNRTQFPSLGIFVSKKVGNQKTKTTFIISVLKVVY